MSSRMQVSGFSMFNFICSRSLPNLGNSLRTSPINALFKLSFSFSFSSLSSSSSTPNSLSDSSNEHSFTVNYLINSCGLPPESALSASKRLNIKKPDRADSVLSFFSKHGFTENQISGMVKSEPLVLTGDPENTFLPKLEFLSSIGLSSTELARVITLEPNILKCSLKNRIIPNYSFFRNLLQSDEKTVSTIKRFPRLFTYDLHVYAVQNIQILLELGVPKSNIAFYVTYHARDLLSPTDKYRKVVEQVKEMGFDPLKITFMSAVIVLGSMSKSTWEKKAELYRKWGWSEDDIFVSFRKYPWCMAVSEDKITRVMDFFINKMGLKSSLLVRSPVIMAMSLEKRIVPRCLIYQVVLNRGLIKKEMDFRFATWLQATEKDFIIMIRKKYKEEAPQLLKLYQAKLDPAN